jgi:hypothetical protein
MLVTSIAFGLGATSTVAARRQPPCSVTSSVVASAPPTAGADPIRDARWYINAERTIWAHVPDSGWPAGGFLFGPRGKTPGQKTYWVRPRGTTLRITGRRIDGNSPGFAADGYGTTTSDFEIVALYSPTVGCWEVEAAAGAHTLRFVTEVRTIDPREP